MADEQYGLACRAVAAAFIAAYPEYVQSRLHPLGAGDVADAAVCRGAQWLEGELTQWADEGSSQQRRGPLQIFQTALAFPTAALEDAGLNPPPRDPGSVSALPGDTFGLAPASSRDIGAEAWRAHVAWGVTKAKRVADVVPQPKSTGLPSVAVVTMSGPDRAAIQLVAAGRGIAAHHLRNPGAVAAAIADGVPRWAAVDAEHLAAEEAVRLLVDAGSKVALYAPAPDDIATARWLALGVATVLPRDRLVAVLESWLPIQA